MLVTPCLYSHPISVFITLSSLTGNGPLIEVLPRLPQKRHSWSPARSLRRGRCPRYIHPCLSPPFCPLGNSVWQPTHSTSAGHGWRWGTAVGRLRGWASWGRACVGSSLQPHPECAQPMFIFLQTLVEALWTLFTRDRRARGYCFVCMCTCLRKSSA